MQIKKDSRISLESSIKDVGIFLAVFEIPLPHVEILTLIYLTSNILQHSNLRPPLLLKYFDVFYGEILLLEASSKQSLNTCTVFYIFVSK